MFLSSVLKQNFLKVGEGEKFLYSCPSPVKAASLSEQKTHRWFVSQAVMQLSLAETPRIPLQLSLLCWTKSA